MNLIYPAPQKTPNANANPRMKAADVFKFKKMLVRRDSGVSLIIAIIFVSVFLLVMAGLAESNMKTFESIRDREASGKLLYITESIEEIASSWAASHGVGVNSSSSPDEIERISEQLAAVFAEKVGIDCDLDPSEGNVEPCVNFEVTGHTPEDEKVRLSGQRYFSVPISGTGNAAKSCSVDLADSNSANDPCHWNKLYVGQRVEIPLYVEGPDADRDGEFDVTKADFSASGGSFKLRIRTPKCDPDSRATDSSCIEMMGLEPTAEQEWRLKLYPQVSLLGPGSDNVPYRHTEYDPVLIQWTIDDAGGEGALISNDAAGGNRRPDPDDLLGGAATNTELSAGRINAAQDIIDALQDFIVLEGAHQGYTGNQEAPPTIASFVDNGDSGVWPAIAPPTKPILHLNLVGQPRRYTVDSRDRPLTSEELNNRNLDIPYLEYQLLTTDPVSDSKSLLTGSVQIPGFYRDFKKNKNRSTTLGGFALESF